MIGFSGIRPALPLFAGARKTAAAASAGCSDTLSLGNHPQSCYGHLRYLMAEPDDLEPIYPDQPHLLHRKAAEAFRKMAAAAAKDGIVIAPVSCFRTLERQRELFYDYAERKGISLEERAKVCAPPGYSEHHTGYTLDLRDNTPGMLLDQKFAETPAFQWMLQNARRFGFELSFPEGNRQGVMFEPWHWRWAGDRTSRKIFAAARKLNG